MQKIPVPTYREYLKKYKVMNVKELEEQRTVLENKHDEAVSNWTETQLHGTTDQEYEAYLIARNVNAELEVLNSVLNLKRIEEL